MTDAPAGDPAPDWVGVGGVMLAAVGFGLVPVFVRWLGATGMDPAAIAFWRYSVTALVALPWLRLTGDRFGPSGMGLMAGIAMGLGWIGYVVAVERTTIASAGVLYMTYPVFTLVFAFLLLRQRPGPRALIAAALVLLAAVISTPGPLEGLGAPDILLALAAPCSFGFAITVLAGWLSRITAMERLAVVPLGACFGLAFIVTDLPAERVIPAWEEVPLVLALSVVTSLVPSWLYVVSAPRIGASATATAGAIELPTMFALGWLVFGEALGVAQFAAGALVVGAILLVSISRQPKTRPPAA